MEITRNRIREALMGIVKENVEILDEMWSHSEEIDKGMELIYNTITKNMKKSHVETIVKKQLHVYIGSAPMEIFGMNISLKFFVYLACNDEVAQYAMQHCYSENGLSGDYRTLTLTLFTVNGELMERNANMTVGHEVEHLFQISKRKENNVKNSELMGNVYRQASETISQYETHSEAEVNIAWLVYYSNPREQDAFMNEYYYDLSWMKQFVFSENNEAKIRLLKYEEKINWYHENKDNDEVKNILLTYKINGMSQHNFEKMIEKGLNRYKKKMKNIEKHFKNTVEYLNEHNYRHGICTHTGSLIYLL